MITSRLLSYSAAHTCRLSCHYGITDKRDWKRLCGFCLAALDFSQNPGSLSQIFKIRNREPGFEAVSLMPSPQISWAYHPKVVRITFISIRVSTSFFCSVSVARLHSRKACASPRSSTYMDNIIHGLKTFSNLYTTEILSLIGEYMELTLHTDELFVLDYIQLEKNLQTV